MLPGEPDSREEMADWLLSSLRVVTEGAGEDVVLARRASSRIWEGESGEAYREFTRSLVQASDETSSDILTAEDAFRQCGVHLRAAQEVLEGCRRKAVAGGLVVIGPQVVPPEPAVDPGPAPRRAPVRATEHWNEQQSEFGEQERKVALYQRLAREASTARQEYEQWCESNLGSAPSGGGEGNQLVASLLSYLESTAAKVLNFQFSYAAKSLAEQVTHLRSEVQDARARAARINGDMKSKNPARRGPAGHESAREANRRAWTLEQLAERYGKSPVRHLPLLGNLMSLGLSAKQISDGESPGKVVSSEVTATLVGVVVVASAPASLSVFTVVGSTIVLATAAHGGAELIWDALPADVREDIDAGLKKAWEKGKDVGGDIVEGTVDGLKSLTGGIG
ncbi:MAG: hypothetical protein L0H93_08320 [Nocardioides sp.]|nr:hypothetical protein [Nocardioides sp.]